VLVSDELEAKSHSNSMDGESSRCCCLSPKAAGILCGLAFLVAVGCSGAALIVSGINAKSWRSRRYGYDNYDDYEIPVVENSYWVQGCDMQTVPLFAGSTTPTPTAAEVDVCQCLSATAAATSGMLCTKIVVDNCISSSELHCAGIEIVSSDIDEVDLKGVFNKRYVYVSVSVCEFGFCIVCSLSVVSTLPPSFWCRRLRANR
jgi:hypothetical protein